MASVCVPWSHCAKKFWKHEIIKTINSCGYSTFYNTDHFSCSSEQIGNPEAEGGNDVTWGTKKSENKKSGTLGSAGEIEENPFTPMQCHPFLRSFRRGWGEETEDISHYSSAVFCLRFTSYKIKTRVIILRVAKWLDFFLCNPFILSGSPNECWLYACRTCVIATLRLGLREKKSELNK